MKLLFMALFLMCANLFGDVIETTTSLRLSINRVVELGIKDNNTSLSISPYDVLIGTSPHSSSRLTSSLCSFTLLDDCDYDLTATLTTPLPKGVNLLISLYSYQNFIPLTADTPVTLMKKISSPTILKDLEVYFKMTAACSVAPFNSSGCKINFELIRTP